MESALKELSRKVRKSFDEIRGNISEGYYHGAKLSGDYKKGMTISETYPVEPTLLPVLPLGKTSDPIRYEVQIIVHVKPIE